MKSLYFVAILPPEPILEEIKHFKEQIRDKYGSARALRSPAHITLIPPFHADTEQLEEVSGYLKKCAAATPEFALSLNGVGSFPPRVVFIKPDQSDKLESLQSKLISKGDLWSKYSKREFHPHMTIAFRDVTPEIYERIWTEYSELDYQREFTADKLTLLINGKDGWSVLREYFFEGR